MPRKTKKTKKAKAKVTRIRKRKTPGMSGAERAAKKRAARKKLTAEGRRKKYPKRQTEFGALITLVRAKALLSLNYEGQRNLRPTRVDQFCGILRRGLWIESGEPIIIDWFGNLIDGQHRLAAIVKTGISAKIDITYGVPPKAFDVIDSGAVRALYDILPVEFPKQVSALYRVYLDFKSTEGMTYTSFGRRSASAFREDRTGAIQWAQRNEKLLTKIIKTCHVDKDARALLRPPAVFNAFYFMVARKSPKEADAFFRTLIDGVAFEQGAVDPIYQLRQNLLQFNDKYKNKRGTAVPLWTIGAMLIKAWNAYMKRASVRQLRMMSSEKWPEITSRTTRARKSIARKAA